MSPGVACELRRSSLNTADAQREHTDRITANSFPAAGAAISQKSQSSCCRTSDVHRQEGRRARRSWTRCADEFPGTSSARKRGCVDGEHGAGRGRSEGGR